MVSVKWGITCILPLSYKQAVEHLLCPGVVVKARLCLCPSGAFGPADLHRFVL